MWNKLKPMATARRTLGGFALGHEDQKMGASTGQHLSESQVPHVFPSHLKSLQTFRSFNQKDTAVAV